MRAWGLALAMMASVAWSNTFVFEGQAFDPSTGDSLYLETHTIQRDDQGRYLRAQVLYEGYEDGAGKEVWARKELLFDAAEPLLPELVFENLRFGGKTSVALTAEEVVIERQAGQTLEQARLDRPSGMAVADAGFDRMVQQHWERLIADQTVRFEFLALTRGKWVSFRIKAIEQDAESIVMRVEPDNWLFRMLVDPIILRYDLAKRRLRRFVGLTNIPRNESGDHYEARIEYRYADEQEGGNAP